MRFAKRFLMVAGAGALAAILAIAIAPKTAHGLAAALVQVANTPSNPVPTADANKATAQNVELLCTTIVPEYPLGTVPVCTLVSQTNGVSGPTEWTVPAG